MTHWTKLATEEEIEKTKKALQENGITVYITGNRTEAQTKVHELLPVGSEVITMTSTTLDTLGLTQEINESGKYNSVRQKFNDPQISDSEKRRLGAAPEYVIGSVHAVTQDGHVLIASQSGSQLPAYVYGATKVIWVLGTQKIVKNTDEGIKRIYEYCLPKEDERARKAYGVGSAVNKLLIINREKVVDRIHLIFVKELLGF